MSVFFIAEAGVNHNGDLNIARALIDIAAESGADAVKFQTFSANKLASQETPKAAYQVRHDSTNSSHLEMLKKLELTKDAHKVLKNHCATKEVLFLSSPFDNESLAFLTRELNIPMIKIPSGELTNGPLLLDAGRSGKKVILSTGMCTLDDVRAALDLLAFAMLEPIKLPSDSACKESGASAEGKRLLKERVTVLQCTTDYPTPIQDVNLRAMCTMRDTYDLNVGLSDHSVGHVAAIMAVGLGASVIEKHFTIDRDLPGPDHQASIDPEGLKQMIAAIRQAELALGNDAKVPGEQELLNINVARKSLFAATDISAGEAFTEDNLTAKRPGYGISPMCYWSYLGRAAKRDYKAGEMIKI